MFISRTNVLEAVQVVWWRLLFHFLGFLHAIFIIHSVYVNYVNAPCPFSDSGLSCDILNLADVADVIANSTPYSVARCILKSSNDVFSIFAVANSISCTSENYSAIARASQEADNSIFRRDSSRIRCLTDSNTLNAEMNRQFHWICRRELSSTN